MSERTDDVGASTSQSSVAADTRSVREQAGERAAKDSGLGAFFAELPVLVLIAFVLALLLKTFLVQAFFIPSESMIPTLEIGDRVLVNKVVYELREPRRGEIVVFSQDPVSGADPEPGIVRRLVESLTSGLGLVPAGERDFIKRIVGLPGETIAMRDGVVLINGQPLTEAPARNGGYLAARDRHDFGPITVPEGEYFMMGDNRRNSSDSRTVLGTVSSEEIIGRAFVVIWPVGRVDVLSAPDYDRLRPDQSLPALASVAP